jgi:hypothetical protein
MQPVWTTASTDIRGHEQLHTSVLLAHKLVGFLQCSSPVDMHTCNMYCSAISEIVHLSFTIATFVFRKRI